MGARTAGVERLDCRVSGDGFHPIGCLEIQDVQNHGFSVEGEMPMVFESPAGELAIGAFVVRLRGHLDGGMSPGQQFIKENLVDMPTNFFTAQVGLEAAEKTFR